MGVYNQMRYLIIMFLLFCSPVYGATQQMLTGCHPVVALDASTTEYGPVGSTGGQASWNATEQVLQVLYPAAGSITDLRIVLQNDPDNGGGVQSFTFAVRVNGAEPASTLTCVVDDGNTTCTDLVNSVAIVADDLVALQVVPANTPTVGFGRCSFLWNPTTDDETVILGATGSNDWLADNTTRYGAIVGFDGPDPTEFDVTFIAPTAGVFQDLYIWQEVAPGAGNTRTWTFRDSTSAESIVVTLTDSETTDNNTSDTVTATAGEKFVLQQVGASTPVATEAKYAIVFKPTVTGEFIMAFSGDDNLHITATEYMVIGGVADPNWNGTETNFQQPVETGTLAIDMIIKNIHVELETDPGASPNAFDFTLRANGGNATASLTCQVDDVSPFTCNASATVTISDGDLMSTQVVPTSSPTVGSAMISYLGFIDPTVVVERRIWTTTDAKKIYDEYNCGLCQKGILCFGCDEGMSHDLDEIFTHWKPEWDQGVIKWDAPLNMYAFIN